MRRSVAMNGTTHAGGPYCNPDYYKPTIAELKADIASSDPTVDGNGKP